MPRPVVPIFPSPALDRLTRAHPATPAIVFLPIVSVLGFLAAALPASTVCRMSRSIAG